MPQYRGDCGHCGFVAHSLAAMEKHIQTHASGGHVTEPTHDISSDMVGTEDNTEDELLPDPDSDDEHDWKRMEMSEDSEFPPFETAEYPQGYDQDHNMETCDMDGEYYRELYECDNDQPEQVGQNSYTYYQEPLIWRPTDDHNNQGEVKEELLPQNETVQPHDDIDMTPRVLEEDGGCGYAGPNQQIYSCAHCDFQSNDLQMVQEHTMSEHKTISPMEEDEEEEVVQEEEIEAWAKEEVKEEEEEVVDEEDGQSDDSMSEDCSLEKRPSSKLPVLDLERACIPTYQCAYNECPAIFNEYWQLTSHVETVHSRTTAKVHHCGYCNYAAANHEYLQDHIKMHLYRDSKRDNVNLTVFQINHTFVKVSETRDGLCTWSYRCLFCDVPFNSANLCIEHTYNKHRQLWMDRLERIHPGFTALTNEKGILKSLPEMVLEGPLKKVIGKISKQVARKRVTVPKTIKVQKKGLAVSIRKPVLQLPPRKTKVAQSSKRIDKNELTAPRRIKPDWYAQDLTWHGCRLKGPVGESVRRTKRVATKVNYVQLERGKCQFGDYCSGCRHCDQLSKYSAAAEQVYASVDTCGSKDKSRPKIKSEPSTIEMNGNAYCLVKALSNAEQIEKLRAALFNANRGSASSSHRSGRVCSVENNSSFETESCGSAENVCYASTDGYEGNHTPDSPPSHVSPFCNSETSCRIPRDNVPTSNVLPLAENHSTPENINSPPGESANSSGTETKEISPTDVNGNTNRGITEAPGVEAYPREETVFEPLDDTSEVGATSSEQCPVLSSMLKRGIKKEENVTLNSIGENATSVTTNCSPSHIGYKATAPKSDQLVAQVDSSVSNNTSVSSISLSSDCVGRKQFKPVLQSPMPLSIYKTLILNLNSTDAGSKKQIFACERGSNVFRPVARVLTPRMSSNVSTDSPHPTYRSDAAISPPQKRTIHFSQSAASSGSRGSDCAKLEASSVVRNSMSSSPNNSILVITQNPAQSVNAHTTTQCSSSSKNVMESQGLLAPQHSTNSENPTNIQSLLSIQQLTQHPSNSQRLMNSPRVLSTQLSSGSQCPTNIQRLLYSRHSSGFQSKTNCQSLSSGTQFPTNSPSQLSTQQSLGSPCLTNTPSLVPADVTSSSHTDVKDIKTVPGLTYGIPTVRSTKQRRVGLVPILPKYENKVQDIPSIQTIFEPHTANVPTDRTPPSGPISLQHRIQCTVLDHSYQKRSMDSEDPEDRLGIKHERPVEVMYGFQKPAKSLSDKLDDIIGAKTALPTGRNNSRDVQAPPGSKIILGTRGLSYSTFSEKKPNGPLFADSSMHASSKVDTSIASVAKSTPILDIASCRNRPELSDSEKVSKAKQKVLCYNEIPKPTIRLGRAKKNNKNSDSEIKEFNVGRPRFEVRINKATKHDDCPLLVPQQSSDQTATLQAPAFVNQALQHDSWFTSRPICSYSESCGVNPASSQSVFPGSQSSYHPVTPSVRMVSHLVTQSIWESMAEQAKSVNTPPAIHVPHSLSRSKETEDQALCREVAKYGIQGVFSPPAIANLPSDGPPSTGPQSLDIPAQQSGNVAQLLVPLSAPLAYANTPNPVTSSFLQFQVPPAQQSCHNVVVPALPDSWSGNRDIEDSKSIRKCSGSSNSDLTEGANATEATGELLDLYSSYITEKRRKQLSANEQSKSASEKGKQRSAKALSKSSSKKRIIEKTAAKSKPKPPPVVEESGVVKKVNPKKHISASGSCKYGCKKHQLLMIPTKTGTKFLVVHDLQGRHMSSEDILREAEKTGNGNGKITDEAKPLPSEPSLLYSSPAMTQQVERVVQRLLSGEDPEDILSSVQRASDSVRSSIKGTHSHDPHRKRSLVSAQKTASSCTDNDTAVCETYTFSGTSGESCMETQEHTLVKDFIVEVTDAVGVPCPQTEPQPEIQDSSVSSTCTREPITIQPIDEESEEVEEGEDEEDLKKWEVMEHERRFDGRSVEEGVGEGAEVNDGENEGKGDGTEAVEEEELVKKKANEGEGHVDGRMKEEDEGYDDILVSSHFVPTKHRKTMANLHECEELVSTNITIKKEGSEDAIPKVPIPGTSETEEGIFDGESFAEGDTYMPCLDTVEENSPLYQDFYESFCESAEREEDNHRALSLADVSIEICQKARNNRKRKGGLPKTKVRTSKRERKSSVKCLCEDCRTPKQPSLLERQRKEDPKLRMKPVVVLPDIAILLRHFEEL